MLLKILFIFLFIFSLTHLSAQNIDNDSIYHLLNVEVIDTRAKELNTGFKVENIEKKLLKSYTGGSIADVLSSASGVNIKSYGPGGLSSISIRGGSSSHTAIMWNGINLQSPMNGGLNLSALPLDLIEDASIQYGGSGSLVGSGAAFGVLRLSSSPSLGNKNTAFLNTSLGSYSNYRLAMGSNFHFGKSFFTLKGFYQESENDFEFINTAKYGKPKEKQTNSAFKQAGIILDNKTIVSDNTIFIGSIFFNYYDKDIQTLMSSHLPSEANQIDNNLMITTAFKYSKNKIKINFKNAFINSKNNYNDPNSTEPESLNQSKSFISELESTFTIKDNQNIYTALNYTFEQASSSGGYTTDPHRNRFSLIGAYKLTNLWNKVNAVFSIRDEVIDNKLTPLQLSLGVDGNIISFLDFNLNIGKVYRVPTMNDLHWKETAFATGNPNLKDESGYSSDFGISQSFDINTINIKLQQTIFYNYINNLIVWTPRKLDNKWEPINKNVGISKGVELGLDISFLIGKSKLGIKESYSYTDATTSENEGKTWDMQIYIPIHNLNNILWWEYNNFNSNFTLNFYSERNIDNTGNSLPQYAIGDFSLGYTFDLKKLNIEISSRVSNIWDTQYQVTSGYAMPLRNYMVSAKFSIK